MLSASFGLAHIRVAHRKDVLRAKHAGDLTAPATHAESCQIQLSARSRLAAQAEH
jgi:hypothetical protein